MSPGSDLVRVGIGVRALRLVAQGVGELGLELGVGVAVGVGVGLVLGLGLAAPHRSNMLTNLNQVQPVDRGRSRLTSRRRPSAVPATPPASSRMPSPCSPAPGSLARVRPLEA